MEILSRQTPCFMVAELVSHPVFDALRTDETPRFEWIFVSKRFFFFFLKVIVTTKNIWER